VQTIPQNYQGINGVTVGQGLHLEGALYFLSWGLLILLPSTKLRDLHVLSNLHSMLGSFEIEAHSSNQTHQLHLT
jgi:hypothetical protein